MQQDKINDTNFMKVYFGITILAPIALAAVAIHYIKSNKQLRSELNTTRSELKTMHSETDFFFKKLFWFKRQELIDVSEKSKDETREKILDVSKKLDGLSFITKDPATADEVSKIKEEIIHISVYIQSIIEKMSGISKKRKNREDLELLYMTYLIDTLDAFLIEIERKK